MRRANTFNGFQDPRNGCRSRQGQNLVLTGLHVSSSLGRQSCWLSFAADEYRRLNTPIVVGELTNGERQGGVPGWVSRKTYPIIVFSSFPNLLSLSLSLSLSIYIYKYIYTCMYLYLYTYKYIYIGVTHHNFLVCSEPLFRLAHMFKVRSTDSHAGYLLQHTNTDV